MPNKKKFLWLPGLLLTGIYTHSCSYCGCIVNGSLRQQHEDFHGRIKELEEKIEELNGKLFAS